MTPSISGFFFRQVPAQVLSSIPGTVGASISIMVIVLIAHQIRQFRQTRRMSLQEMMDLYTRGLSWYTPSYWMLLHSRFAAGPQGVVARDAFMIRTIYVVLRYLLSFGVLGAILVRFALPYAAWWFLPLLTANFAIFLVMVPGKEHTAFIFPFFFFIGLTVISVAFLGMKLPFLSSLIAGLIAQVIVLVLACAITVVCYALDIYGARIALWVNSSLLPGVQRRAHKAGGAPIRIQANGQVWINPDDKRPLYRLVEDGRPGWVACDAMMRAINGAIDRAKERCRTDAGLV